MKIPYPDIEPYSTHKIAVGQSHVLNVEECGNPEGIPVLFLHGGPGSHYKPHHRSLFNPSIYRIVLFDQRGAGHSTPSGNLQNNTTVDLVADIETIRKQLKIPKWVIFGSSWGTTLGLVYAQQYSEYVLALILRGTFLARTRDINWGYVEGGVSRIFPQQWQAFTDFLPKNADTPLANYYDCLTGKDTALSRTAAIAWAAWNGYVVSYGEFTDPIEFSEELLNAVRIECHYMFNRCFLEENQLLQNINKLANIPAIIIHGQRDLVCPLENSYLLKQNWSMAQLKIVPTGGHLASDPETISTIVEATDEIFRVIDFFYNLDGKFERKR
ncbi:prolyl aminopeptidase [Candidatus Parabeggiatoa sp. HSG14]|uniref:prolyl aminopeptidase n=1 Tax=Candidatus Parabeggiatoa sp. HSG14 TaxID=3055593 RepID=UPI0025A7127F|nr:prolyl aminopeptidase [Thiotrichales bacterium HSG14]